MNQNCKKIIDHISRLEGQLASVKKELQTEKIDCSKASRVILAASRSFATLRVNFINNFLTEKYGLNTAETELKDLLSIIKG